MKKIGPGRKTSIENVYVTVLLSAMDEKSISKEEFCELIDNNYNHCFVCKESFDFTDERMIQISRRRNRGVGLSPWNFRSSELTISSRDNQGHMATCDGILVHEECFFREAGDEWRW